MIIHFSPGNYLPYTYDFDSSTELIIKALDYDNRSITKKIELAARNYPQASECFNCGKEATKMCSYYVDVEEKPAFFCKQCAKSHDDTEDCNISDLSNSPRDGVCGYESFYPCGCFILKSIY